MLRNLLMRKWKIRKRYWVLKRKKIKDKNQEKKKYKYFICISRMDGYNHKIQVKYNKCKNNYNISHKLLIIERKLYFYFSAKNKSFTQNPWNYNHFLIIIHFLFLYFSYYYYYWVKRVKKSFSEFINIENVVKSNINFNLKFL